MGLERPAKVVAAGRDSHVLVARQPILDRQKSLYGYELLFRGSQTAAAADESGDLATASVVAGALSSFSLDELTNGRRAFINITEQQLLSGLPVILPPSKVVLELLEHVEAHDEVIEACRALRRDGYMIALDDFTLNERTAGLIGVADIIKVDLLSTTEPDVRRLVAAARGPRRVKLLAEKIETVEQFSEATQEGFDYFQGYFFGRPVTSAVRKVPGHHLGYLQLLQALYNPATTLQEIENLIKHDPSLCLRVLRTVNSAGFAQYSEVDSIGRALFLLGRDTVCRWTALWILAGVGQSAHPELLVMSTVRARCCELLDAAIRGDEHGADGFLLGICSLLDAILESPMLDILSALPLSESTKAALSGQDTRERRLLDCVIAYERGNWDTCLARAAELGISADLLPPAHREALRWSRDLQLAAA